MSTMDTMEMGTMRPISTIIYIYTLYSFYEPYNVSPIMQLYIPRSHDLSQRLNLNNRLRMIQDHVTYINQS